jgi:uncharacterized protein (TIGR01777 family)
MKVLISGGSGFIGASVVETLLKQGHSVVRLTRAAVGKDSEDVRWNPSTGYIEILPEPLDAVIHLAGENIFGRWTTAKKDRIRASRVDGTLLLSEHLASMQRRPRVFICASAIGFYGNRGDEVLTETADAGEGFLSNVCRDWEAACTPADAAGIRVVRMRFGTVLAKHGGALGKMLGAFKAGLGGTLGNGQQWVSWITLNDALRAILYALDDETFFGAVNVTTPEPVQNRTFTETLGHILHRPTRLSLPAVILRLVLGRFAEETLLASTRAVPRRLLGVGFKFEHPALAQALPSLLK